MELITKKVEKDFMSRPLRSQDGRGFDAEVIVKYFNPCGSGTWLITEAEEQEDGDWLLFGYAAFTNGNGATSCCPNYGICGCLSA